MSNKQRYYRRWLYRAPIGLATVGFGACLIAEAAMQKYAGADGWIWVSYGTVALVVFNTGLSFFGDAVLNRTRYERLLEREQKNAE